MTSTDGQPFLSPAEIYERMVPAYASWVIVLLDGVQVRSGERLLDVACGTGVLARQAVALVGAGGRVVGLDINANMLTVARARGPAVEWHEGNALALPFADHAFDVVVCQQGLQFFPDPGAGLREMRRVLSPGGRLGVAVWCTLESSPGHHALVRALERHVSPEAARVMSTPFRLGDAQTLHALTAVAELRDVHVRLEQRAVRFPSTEAFTRGVLGGGTLARAGIQVSGDALDTVIGDVDQALAPYVQAAGLVFPMESHLILVRA
jgi:ubiquinone/menaquinone biosynthesis C-methylase UbiE